MPHRFSAAGAWTGVRHAAGGALAGVRHAAAANDNPPAPTGTDFASRALLRDALRHFAAYGDGAAEHARNHAEQAFFAGKRREYLRWMAICRTLDRRMVAAVSDAPPPRR